MVDDDGGAKYPSECIEEAPPAGTSTTSVFKAVATTGAVRAPTSSGGKEVHLQPERRVQSSSISNTTKVGVEDPLLKQRMHLSEDDIREFREIFNLVDSDGSGAISCKELEQLVESVGMKLTPQELQEMINDMDKDQSGEIEVDEFVSILCKDLALDYSADEITNAFKMFSRNAPNGLIRMSDLEEALKVYLKEVSGSEISQLLKQFEDCAVYLSQVVDADGFPVPFFRYQDYINLMMRKRT